MRMRTKGIVEASNIGKKALLQVVQGGKAATIEFFQLQELEKALHNSIVIRMTLSGKRLYHVQPIQFFAKIRRSELGTPVRMEHDAGRDISCPHCVPQGVNGQKTVDFAAYPASNYFSGKQVQDRADIVKSAGNSNVGKIADPDQVRSFLVKSLGQQIRIGPV